MKSSYLYNIKLPIQMEKDKKYPVIFSLNIGQENYDYLREQVESIKYTIYPTVHEISDNNKQDVVAWLRQELEKNTQNK